MRVKVMFFYSGGGFKGIRSRKFSLEAALSRSQTENTTWKQSLEPPIAIKGGMSEIILPENLKRLVGHSFAKTHIEQPRR
jgi:hypothetical protein